MKEKKRAWILKGQRHIIAQKSWYWFFAGGLLGYGLIHPFVMVTGKIMSASLHGRDVTQTLFVTMLSAFSLDMLPWGLGFAFLSGFSGLLWCKIRQARAQKLKLQAIMELAGAACHELHQPMQVVLGYADLLSKQMAEAEPLRNPLKKIIEQIEKMAVILRKINNITSYETCDYIQGIRIVDIDKSSKTCPVKWERKEKPLTSF